MIRKFPSNFKNYDIWDAYCKCISKSQVGDVLHLYVHPRSNLFSPVMTEKTLAFPIIKKIKTRNNLFGNKYDFLVGYTARVGHLYPANEEQFSKDPRYKYHKYVFWVYPWDAIVKSIVRDKK